jgi:hypothetical protein
LIALELSEEIDRRDLVEVDLTGLQHGDCGLGTSEIADGRNRYRCRSLPGRVKSGREHLQQDT